MGVSSVKTSKPTGITEDELAWGLIGRNLSIETKAATPQTP